MAVMVTMTLDEYNEKLRLERLFGKSEGIRQVYDELSPILTEMDFITSINDSGKFNIGFDGVTDKYRHHLRQLMIGSKQFK